MDNYIRILKDEDFKESTWSGGKTTEMFIYPEGSEYSNRDFKIRVSSATVELDEINFTEMDGIHRFIAPLDKKLRLEHDNNEVIDLKPFEIHEFDGNKKTISFGKVKDFNLMVGKGAKGVLKNFYIDEKKHIIILTNSGFNILYSYDCLFRISIDEEEYMLLPNEILIMKSNEMKNIKIQSNESSNILLSHIVL